MTKNNVASAVERISRPVVEGLGLELVDVEYVKEGGNWFLRIFIDKPGGVSHSDCEAVSQGLDEILDEEDLVPQSYYLEVSSPGVERPLKKPEDFRRFSGHMVNVTTYTPLEGRKKFRGKLAGLEDGVLFLDEEGGRTAIPMDRVSSARLHYEF
ncbi:MAG: ribosome maturation factor RimP [Bacillota bacterium]